MGHGSTQWPMTHRPIPCSAQGCAALYSAVRDSALSCGCMHCGLWTCMVRAFSEWTFRLWLSQGDIMHVSCFKRHALLCTLIEGDSWMYIVVFEYVAEVLNNDTINCHISCQFPHGIICYYWSILLCISHSDISSSFSFHPLPSVSCREAAVARDVTVDVTANAFSVKLPLLSQISCTAVLLLQALWRTKLT